MPPINDIRTLEKTVRQTVAEVPITDIHTHIFPPSHGDILLWGVDELINYHYLVAELFTVAPADITYEKFWSLSKRQRADLIWKHVFLKHGPLSEATRGVLTTLTRLGLDPADRDLKRMRKYFADQTAEGYVQKVFELAGLDYAIMTNNPYVAAEAQAWKADLPKPKFMKPALRIDPMLIDWPNAARAMAADGYDTRPDRSGPSFAEARRFLADWTARMKPVYMAASLGDDFVYPGDNMAAQVLREVVLPAARELGLPVAMMIGVRKLVNPDLGDGGDAVGIADVSAVQNLCTEHPDVKFLVTMLSRVNQHSLAVLGRKFRNLHLFGCWWFNNNPSIIEEMNRQRIELLGTAFTCQHSDARVLDQLIYKWTHTRAIMADVLADKYRDQFNAGWRTTSEEIRRDMKNLFGGSFQEFLAR